jgi:glycosyltransferase involved in cell wall biosynthesis
LRVGFDATSLREDGKGLARFQLEFLRAAAVDDMVVFVPGDVDETLCPRVEGWRYVRVRTRPMVLWEQLGRPRAARREGVDVVLHLSERAALWGVPQVVYVYEHPKYRFRRNREVGAPLRQRLVDRLTVPLFQRGMRRAAVVLVSSESTARDLAGLTAPEVVYPGVSDVFAPGPDEPSYFLHLASSDPRDNSEVVLDAYARLENTRPPLVIGGNAPGTLRRRADELDLDVQWPGFLTEQALAGLYRGAIAYVDPSLYEGFGLQAAEALACGTPVICSNVTSLPEVVGDAGLLFDPNDVEGFANAMSRVLDGTTRADLSRRAVEQARRFSWSRTAQQCLDACARAVA